MERNGRGDQAAAEAYFSKAMQAAPQDAASYTRLGELRLNQKRFDDAEKLFQQALDRDANSVEAMRAFIAVQVQRNQPARGLSALEAQIAKSPRNGGFYLLLGELLVERKDPAGAETALEKAIDLSPNLVDAFLQLGQLEVQRGSVDKAVSNYQQAIQKNPRDLRLQLAEGAVEESRGDWQAAEKLYQQALQIQPDNPAAANNLAYLLLEHGGSNDVALSMAQIARRGLPNLPSTADTLAWAYYHKALYNSAIDLLQEAVKASPGSATYHYHLGLAYQKKNDDGRAKEQFERALQLNPPPSEAEEIRKALASPSATSYNSSRNDPDDRG
jgi:tetratricopeptide (TPR) repeat protein